VLDAAPHVPKSKSIIKKCTQNKKKEKKEVLVDCHLLACSSFPLMGRTGEGARYESLFVSATIQEPS